MQQRIWIASSAAAVLLSGSVVWFILGGRGGGGPLALDAQASAAEQRPTFEGDVAPFLKQYCGECHAEGAQEGDFAIDRYATLDSLKRDRTIWKKVFNLVKIGAMPPPDSPQPEEQKRTQIVGWLDHELFFVDCSGPIPPGRVTIRRLNKTEYNNTVRDLLGVDFEPAADFPSDDVGYGFDNIGDVLSVPP